MVRRDEQLIGDSSCELEYGETGLTWLVGGWVVDGSGASREKRDVLFNDRILAVGAIPRELGLRARKIDVGGLIVAPGFIDAHTHSELDLLRDPTQEAKLRQGVATQVIGHDGLSYAPMPEGPQGQFLRYLAGLNGPKPEGHSWSSVADYRSLVNRRTTTNTVVLIPHGAIRLALAGFSPRRLSETEIRRGRELVENALSEGAVGMSTGLSYVPCTYADVTEIAELAAPVGQVGGVFVPHLRAMAGKEMSEAVQEVIEIASRSETRLHLTHYMTFAHNVGQVPAILRAVPWAERWNVPVTFDAYPYPSGSSLTLAILPDWLHKSGPDGIRAALSDSDARQRVIAEVKSVARSKGISSWAGLIISHARATKFEPLVGLDVETAASRSGVDDPAEFVCTMLRDCDLEVGHVGKPPSEEIWERLDQDFMQVMSRADYCIGTDGILVGRRPHPRAFGTFPRALGRLRRRYGHPSLETLVSRASAVAAEVYGLNDRGLIATGKAADAVVFNEEDFVDTATYNNPRVFAKGVEHLYVNGIAVVEGGHLTGHRPGRALPP